MPKLPLDQVITGDCIEVLRTFPEGSIDLIFADPPYNLQLRNELYRPNMTRVDAVDDGWDRFGSFEEYDAFTRLWLTACRTVLKDTGTLWTIGTYHNIYRVGAILQDLGFWILNDIVWVKNNPMPNFRGVRFTNAHESLLWAQKKKGARYTFNHYAMKALNDDLQMRSDWYVPLTTGKERIRADGVKAHPTQKPEALLYRIILSTSNPGDVVLDPFFGSGTTGAVARRLGRHFIGIERDEAYINVALERISAVVPSDPASLDVVNPKPRRIPFGSLLEHGLLHAGQTLFFARDGETAMILANGHIRCGTITGSIHAVARYLMGGMPANGWDLWLYEDKSGEKFSINDLRTEIRIGMSG